LTVFQWSETKDRRAVRKAARLFIARRPLTFRRRKAEDREGA
jgi:hypothetical protein